jgi:hypothetical protein
MILHLFALSAAFAFGAQAGMPPQGAPTGECVNAAETKRLAGQSGIDGRIKAYRDISERYHKAVVSAVAGKRFAEIPPLIACWTERIEVSRKDIEDNVNRKKKSGALIDYEIQLRRSVVDLNSARIKAPHDMQEQFESWIAQAIQTRQKFVDILFQRK